MMETQELVMDVQLTEVQLRQVGYVVEGQQPPEMSDLNVLLDGNRIMC